MVGVAKLVVYIQEKSFPDCIVYERQRKINKNKL